MRSALGVFVALVACLTSACGGDNKRSPQPAGPPPLTSERLHELELTRRVPDQVRKACDEARRVARVRVVCPELIPDIPLTSIEGLWGSLSGREEPRVWMVSFTNAGGFHGRPLKGVEHWIAGGGGTEVVEKWVLSDFVHEAKGDAVLVRTVNVRGRTVRIYRFPSYPPAAQTAATGRPSLTSATGSSSPPSTASATSTRLWRWPSISPLRLASDLLTSSLAARFGRQAPSSWPPKPRSMSDDLREDFAREVAALGPCRRAGRLGS